MHKCGCGSTPNLMNVLENYNKIFLREETFIFPSRYRNFRTFTSPQAVQFSCVTVDSSGEVVCAGSLDTFEIFVWSVKTARLTEVCYWLINVQMI